MNGLSQREARKQTNQINFAALIEPVARLLRGEPNEALSRKGELRFGSRGSLKVDCENGTFYDHERNIGGGTLDLIRAETGRDHSGAIAWLRREGFINGHDKTNGAGKVNGASKPKLVETYDYCDEQGHLLYQVVRFEPKDFRQRRPNGRDWIWDLKGIRRVPYRLPEIIEAFASERTVLIVEGEKDVDNLHRLGIPATTNPGGVKKWRSDYNQLLRGADVVLVPNNDDAGREHVDKIAAGLSGLVKRVRILDIAQHWPECPEKGDISDWITAGGTAEALWDLVEVAPDWSHSTLHLPADPKSGVGRHDVTFPDIWQGNPAKTCANARVAIEVLEIQCRYDVFHNKLLVGGHVIEQWAGELSDHVIYMLRLVIHQVFGFDPGQTNTHDAAVQLCLKHQFDPVCDYLGSLTWDGEPRLDEWMSTYLGAEDTELNREIGKLALIAAVRRARQPGSKFDQIIVLEGSEGTRKSMAIELLAGRENFSDQTILGVKDREQQEMLQGKWLYEIAELSNIKKADVEHIKAFASRTHDRARPAYGRCVVDQPRRCVLFATTNDDTYLKSQTGNRRFWPVKTRTIDIEALRRDRDQLWAEAVAVEATGLPLTLPEHLWEKARIEQEKRLEPDLWDDFLAGIKAELYPSANRGEEERVSTEELLKTHLGLTADRINSSAESRLKFAMRRLGWEGPKPLRFRNGLKRGYRRSVAP